MRKLSLPGSVVEEKQVMRYVEKSSFVQSSRCKEAFSLMLMTLTTSTYYPLKLHTDFFRLGIL